MLDGLTKQFGPTVALDGVDLEIHEGELLTLLGPSGCGKTTSIRLIGGYIGPTSGRVLLDGKDVTNVPPQHRNMGMVFQDYALFPHMTAGENIGYPLKLRKWPRDRIATRVAEMLDLVRLPDIKERHPSQLSGGQQQRVALARALSFSPRVLLMDEALGALDAKLREYMQIEIRRIQQELSITTIHVTHDQDEALGMSDRVVVMRDARIAQVASPRDLYARPSSVYVADFVGRINLLPGRVVSHEDDLTVLEINDPDLEPSSSHRVCASPRTAHEVGTKVKIGIRPENMEIRPQPGAHNCLGGAARDVKFGGAMEYLTFTISPSLSVLVASNSGATPDGSVYLHWPAEKTVVLSEDR